jgi:hypothetical protein
LPRDKYEKNRTYEENSGVLIDNIYKRLKYTRLAPSHAIFSCRFLGRSDRYYDYLRCSGADASLAVLSTLAVRLIALADQFRQDADWSRYAEMLDGMADEVWAEIEVRSYRDAWSAPHTLRAPAALMQG